MAADLRPQRAAAAILLAARRLRRSLWSLRGAPQLVGLASVPERVVLMSPTVERARAPRLGGLE